MRIEGLRSAAGGTSGEDNAGGSAAVGALLALVLVASGCAGRGAAATERPGELDRRASELEAVLDATATAPEPGSVRVRLAFGSGADLDLYVTDSDPRINETVYFAKHTTRSHGRLLHDARCGDAAPRIDAAAFDRIPAMGLRIGVDHHASCAEPATPEPFAVEIAFDGAREVRRGVARPGHFDDRFWMWLPASAEERVDQGARPKVK